MKCAWCDQRIRRIKRINTNPNCCSTDCLRKMVFHLNKKDAEIKSIRKKLFQNYKEIENE